MISASRNDWAAMHDDALWAYRTTYKTPTRASPYKLVYELASEKWLMQLNELYEFHLHTYENSKLYKEKTKLLHDNNNHNCEFELGQFVLLFNSRLRLFPWKLISRWSGLFEIVRVTPHGAIEMHIVCGETTFLVNGQRVKNYYEVDFDRQKSKVLLAND
ncbi:uncharacterized protein LOC142168840 [Nicotiana tabacum]|uniref:Uncharacterized protein LOC142168840 n=1 Tax=Nicotiana tabacum TaxID=4097 RepID=A0AC58SM93_TOBAC